MSTAVTPNHVPANTNNTHTHPATSQSSGDTITSVRAEFNFAADELDREFLKSVGQNWGWLAAAGGLSILGGVVALSAPVLATAAVGTLLMVVLLVVGAFNLAGTFFARKGMKLEHFTVGAIQLVLAGVMAYYPLESIVSLTVLVGAIFLFDGIARITMAVMSRGMPGWGWMLTGGIATFAVSLLILTGLPGAAMWVVGLVVGVHLLASGITRLAIAFDLRRLAKAAA